MQYSAESYLQLHHMSEAEFTRELEIRRVARDRIDEKRGTQHTIGGGRHFFRRG
ncbi:hypothetical protein [Subtercola lobariae]|uniref:Uncharacterized protein n=1 Tax=Subtercola lobariae TaxID=1588641 RepID=A0A917EYN6_9MICO|nr:hypothetical protein [Subtercola lobariae]GGF34633.1 hypothetical protein GCM10011399_29700 [Subtercola lobariae]